MKMLSQVLSEFDGIDIDEDTSIDITVSSLQHEVSRLTSTVGIETILQSTNVDNTLTSMALTENLLSMATAICDIPNDSQLATESDASNLTKTIALESVKDVTRRVMNVINDIISRILEMVKKVKALLNREIPKLRNTLVSIQKKARVVTGTAPKESVTYIRTFANFFQRDGKEVNDKLFSTMPERYEEIAEKTLLSWSGGSVSAIKEYSRLLDALNDSVEDTDLLRMALELGTMVDDIADIAGLGKLESDGGNDKRWEGYDFQKFPMLDDEAVFILRPKLDKPALLEALRTLSKSRAMVARSSTKPKPITLTTTKFKTLTPSDIIDKCDNFINVLDDVTGYQNHSKTRAIEASIKNVRKSAEAFNKEVLGNENSNTLLLRHRSSLVNGITGPINMATVFPNSLIKHLLNATKAYSYVLSQMIKNY